MGLEKLKQAATAAGFAMATSDDVLATKPTHEGEDCSAWRPADPRGLAERSGGETATVPPERGGGLRGWWLLLSGKAPA
jgi:hypothetical protein